jgi:hypothetical protein
MKKIIALLAIALFLMSIPLAAQADTDYKALEAKLAAGQQSLVATADAGYDYGAIFTTYTVDDFWWSGMAVFNASSGDSDFMIGVYADDGSTACTGTFSLGPNESMTDLLQNFMTDGTLPARGAVGLFATQPFYADLVTGTVGGSGFGQLEKAGEPY